MNNLTRAEELTLINRAIQEGKLHRITYQDCDPNKAPKARKGLPTLEELIESLNLC